VNPDVHIILQAGESRHLRRWEIAGGYRPGDDIRVFVYEVTGETAEFRTSVSATASELRENRRQVTVYTLSFWP